MDFNAEALLAKYRAEREKRIRADGPKQFRTIEGDFERYLDDPFIDKAPRPALTDEVEVLIIGGGLAGVLSGARLRQAEFETIRIVDGAGDFGGTWYWNRYPGAACDTESYIYIPMIEELGRMPSRKYARAPEILAHCQAVARKYDLYRNACFHTRVREVRWDDDDGRWLIDTDRGDRIRARFVVASSGPFDMPKLPAIPGAETFKGHSFHTSRWDYGYTGGGPDGDLSGLADKVVGVIGTGATAVQCVPHLAEGAKQLYIFQRTPSPVDARNDSLTDPAWAGSLPDGWQSVRMDNFTAIIAGDEVDEDLVGDGWTEMSAIVRRIVDDRLAAGESIEDMAAIAQQANFEKMEQIRARCDAIVEDPAVAAALKPWYNFFCKRPCFSDYYLQAFNRANVTLVDTDGKGVTGITENAVIANGREYPVDCLIYATGFENIHVDRVKRAGFETYGQGGRPLSDHWRDGARTLHGFLSHGFPNYFIMSVAQSGSSFNAVHMLDEQAKHIAHILGRARAEGIARIEASQEGETDWVAMVESVPFAMFAFFNECTPSYLNNEGDTASINARNGPYGGGATKWLEIVRRWRDEGSMAGLELKRQIENPVAS